jgi:hypothetical protein
MAGTTEGLFGRGFSVAADPNLVFARGFGVEVSAPPSEVDQNVLIQTSSGKMWKSGKPNEIVKELHYNKPKIRKYK